jgi:hypothetical protein
MRPRTIRAAQARRPVATRTAIPMATVAATAAEMVAEMAEETDSSRG